MKRTCWIVEFAVPANYWGKIEKNKKRNKYFDISIELKRLWKIKVTVIPIIADTLGAIRKYLKRRLVGLEIWGRAETPPNTALLGWTIPRNVLGPEEICCQSDSSERPLDHASGEKTRKELLENKKKIWNVTVITIVIGAFGTVTKR